MKALAVLSPSIDRSTENNSKYYLELGSKKIPIAIIEIPDTEFNEADNLNDYSVLVKKQGFSLNYRDLGVIENAWYRLGQQNVDSYYPIGSDFTGKIIKKGKKVRDLEIGDRVVGDCTFPFVHENVTPGIPSNHASKELEIYHYKKVKRIPSKISIEVAATMSIGMQTANSMIRKADIKVGSSILVTSITSNTSLFLLSLLKEKECKVYGLSYSGKKMERVKKTFPFVEEIFNFQNDSLPNDLVFDVILDPFSDTYIENLVNHLNYNAKYITCGVYNQSLESYGSNNSLKNFTDISARLITKNATVVGNCLGSEKDLTEGIRLLSKKEAEIQIDSRYRDENFKDFIEKSFSKDRFGKVVMLY